ncbi:MAG: hypothetical protein ABIS39_06190 [Sphingomicrobium sp.]
MTAPMGTSTFAIVAAVAAAAASPLETAMQSNDQSLCFSRSYDSAWLKAHKGQKVREARLALTRSRLNGSAQMRISLDGRFRPFYLYGECSWYEGDLNRGVQNDILDETFKPVSGVGCHLYTDVTGASAEEGGDFPAEWIDGGRNLQIHLPDGFGAWRSLDVSRNADFHELGANDRIIRLERTPMSACKSLLDRFAPDAGD